MTTTQKRSRLVTAAGLALGILTLGGIAHAGDLCLKYSDGLGGPFGFTTYYRAALKSFRMPSRGRCKPVDGWLRVQLDSVPQASSEPDAFLTGHACTSSDGTTLNVSWTEMYMGVSPATIRIVLPLPLGSSGALAGYREGGTVYGMSNVTPIPCDGYEQLP